MRSRLIVLSLACVGLVAACSSTPIQFWRPISEPNSLLPTNELQDKLDFDLSQCKCGIFPANATHNSAVRYQPDKQRLAQTSLTVQPNDYGNCVQKPSLVVTECMRHRGWELTTCSGRMPLPRGGGSVCAGYQGFN